MLTRCKRGMYICSSKAFVEGKGASSLLTVEPRGRYVLDEAPKDTSVPQLCLDI
ncbi:hypothetical protein BV25DRAFT_1822477 [Artomyces pyxidatus]|uniref:Uncharacterized protein n=1 Tax=Artomyces pyxidatus TaxID=48021 RepID=A0ACB8T8U4_9AGAM|nr:hypothetical protein BV25DRAFT_1822477 [Artomyces pyxidatus]